jgi:hypothetical protein
MDVHHDERLRYDVDTLVLDRVVGNTLLLVPLRMEVLLEMYHPRRGLP